VRPRPNGFSPSETRAMLWVAIIGAALGVIVVVAFAAPIRFAVSSIGGTLPDGPSEAELDRAWLEDGLAGLVIVPGLGSGTFELLERWDLFGVIDASDPAIADATDAGPQLPGVAGLNDASPGPSGQAASTDPADPEPSPPLIAPPPPPTGSPSAVPTPVPTAIPTPDPTATPEPTREPTPTPEPTREPTPEPTPTPEPDRRPECSNGQDDDKDGFTDYGLLFLGDPECGSPFDDSEGS
jgi:hypothetical protein